MKTTNEKELLIKANWSVLTSVCGIGSEKFYLELERLIWKRRARSAANGAVFNQPRLQMTAPVLSFRLNYGEFFARLNFLPDHSAPTTTTTTITHPSTYCLGARGPWWRSGHTRASMTFHCVHCVHWSCIHLSSPKEQPPYIYRASYTWNERHRSPL